MSENYIKREGEFAMSDEEKKYCIDVLRESLQGGKLLNTIAIYRRNNGEVYHSRYLTNRVPCAADELVIQIWQKGDYDLSGPFREGILADLDYIFFDDDKVELEDSEELGAKSINS